MENGVDFGLLAPDTVVNVPSTSTKSTEVSARFRVVMISSVQIRIPTSCQARVLELSFAPTEKSRSDLYSDVILQCWSPQTLDKIKKLEKVQADLRERQSVLEEMLLSALQKSKASKNILDDEELMKVLDQARQQQAEIQQAQQQAHDAEEQLKELRARAEKIALVVGRCEQALEQLNLINPLYVCDDSAIIPILKDILKK